MAASTYNSGDLLALFDSSNPDAHQGTSGTTGSSLFESRVQRKRKYLTVKNKANLCPTVSCNEAGLSNSNSPASKVSHASDGLSPKEVNERTVFVGNLPLDTLAKELKKLFKPFGMIESVRLRSAVPANPKLPKKAAVIRREFHDDCHVISAYIKFSLKSSAGDSLALNGSMFKDRHIRVDLVSNDRKYDPKRTLFLGNLSFGIENEEVYSHFVDCGDIEAVRIVRSSTGLGRGFGFVMFKSSGSCQLGLKLDGSALCGRQIRVTQVSRKLKNSVNANKGNTKSPNKTRLQRTTPKDKKTVATKPSSADKKSGASRKRKRNKIKSKRLKSLLSTL